MVRQETAWQGSGPAGLYVIADYDVLASRGLPLREFAEALRAAEVTTLQWRHKGGSPQEVLSGAAVLREVFADTRCRLVMNDRVDLALLAQFTGVHVGQGDLSPRDVRRIAGADFLVGVSTHTEEEARTAEAGPADYVAVGPVFATGSKADAEPVVGLAGVRRARASTAKPLVAIGGITRQNAAEVIEAGADAVAVISGLLVPGEPPEKVARDFLSLFQ